MQTSEHFLPEIQDVAFFYIDSKKCKQIKSFCFDQVMNYLAKYDFVILSEV
jgi:hypothetical protein